MTARRNRALLVQQDEIVAPPAPRACDDRTFEMPGVLYLVTALLFLGFVSVLSFAFRAPEMAIPFGIFLAFLAAFFLVPSLFVRMTPAENRTSALRWQEFMERGIVTATGRASAREATILVLLLPFLIMSFGIAVAIIAALT